MGVIITIIIIVTKTLHLLVSQDVSALIKMQLESKRLLDQELLWREISAPKRVQSLLRRPYERLESVKGVLVRVLADEGVCGWYDGMNPPDKMMASRLCECVNVGNRILYRTYICPVWCITAISQSCPTLFSVKMSESVNV